MPTVTPQGKYWLLTIPQHLYIPFKPNGVQYVKGQLEVGGDTGYLHWQVLVCFERKVRRARVKTLFGEQLHCEPTRSSAANDYVWKEDTRVQGTQFELGKLPFQRNKETDWEAIRDAAKAGNLNSEEIPADVYIRCYNSLTKIKKDHLDPVAQVREVQVYVGPTGVGKSRRAWDEASFQAYPKDPNTKFWDGYQGQPNVVIDEFRGKIDISNILRWTDRYPVAVETKGSGVVFSASKIWITSNLHPRDWYPDLDQETKDALMRRLNVEEMLVPYYDDIE